MASAAPSASPRSDRNGAMLLDRLGAPGFRFTEFRFIDFRAPRLSYLSPLRGREGAAGQAVVCRLLRGSSPTRGVAPKQHRGAPAWFLSGISGWCSLSLGAWVPKKLASRNMVSAARCCSTGSGRLDLDLLNLDLLISGPRVYLIYHP